jgi:hypothetical protein
MTYNGTACGPEKDELSSMWLSKMIKNAAE